MMTKLESKPLKNVTFQAELYNICHSIRVRGITKNYDEEVLSMYFENPKRSGGGDVEAVELLGDGEAIVTFQDSKGEVVRVIWAKVIACNIHSSEFNRFGSTIQFLTFV